MSNPKLELTEECSLDEKPTQALNKKPKPAISKGNAVQVPNFGDNVSFNSDID